MRLPPNFPSQEISRLRKELREANARLQLNNRKLDETTEKAVDLQAEVDELEAKLASRFISRAQPADPSEPPDDQIAPIGSDAGLGSGSHEGDEAIDDITVGAFKQPDLRAIDPQSIIEKFKSVIEKIKPIINGAIDEALRALTDTAVIVLIEKFYEVVYYLIDETKIEVENKCISCKRAVQQASWPFLFFF